MTLPAGELLALAMLVTLAIAIFSGLPVAVVLIAIGLVFGGLGVLAGTVRAPELGAIFFRIYGTLTESDDLAYASVPVLIFMGAMLQSAAFAGDLLAALQRLAGRRRAALPVAVMAIGLLLAPLAGVIAASVSTLALLALPTLLERGYRPSAAGGIVAAAGTLGVIVPPSIMLFFIADALGAQVPALFLGMLLPAALLFALYVACVLMADRSNHAALPGAPADPASAARGTSLRRLAWPALLLVGMVAAVGLGWSSLSEAAALGAAGATLLAALDGRLSGQTFDAVVHRTVLVTSMIFFIFVGASLFALVFHLLGGGRLLAAGTRALDLGPGGTLAAIMVVVFVLGFFFDWLELVLIAFPIFKPVLDELVFAGHVGPTHVAICWIAVLLTLNIQTSFLTPPFGYALFLLKGSAPPAVRMADLYRGVVPYIVAQIVVLGLVIVFPAIATWLPDRVLDLTLPRGGKFSD
jgi:tripartite ATP-independent transporter DctM subunit